MSGKSPYSSYFVGCCFHDLFNSARSILVQVTSSFFSSRFVKVQVVQLYSSTNSATAWENFYFILSVWFGFIAYQLF